MAENNKAQLSHVEIDTIGEIMNISMGAAATAVSTMLDRQVVITTPKVAVTDIDTFSYEGLEPATGIEIEYVRGLYGSNYLIMKVSDVKMLVGFLIGETDEEEGEGLNEMSLSAISEIMNQMMGSSSTALAAFFGKDINISTPRHFEANKIRDLIHISSDQQIVSVSFRLKIEGSIDSEFITVLPISFTKELVRNAMGIDDDTEDSSLQTDEQPQSDQPAEPAPVGKKTEVKPYNFNDFSNRELLREKQNRSNFELILGVPLDVTVQIGSAMRQVKDILNIRHGTILELDKQAGEPVDIIANGQLIARGTVVVVNDNFGVRITEIVSSKEGVNAFLA